MAKIRITESLFQEIKKKFSKQEAKKIIDRFEEVGKKPKTGKILSSVAGIIIKELKYNKYRFYYVTDGHILKFGSEDELVSLLIKFVKFSDKKNQQKAIDSIKSTLKSFGFDGF